MGKVEIEELGDKSIAEILTLVANPPSLEDRLVEKDMRNLSTAEQDIVKEIYIKKVVNAISQRDEMMRYVLAGVFPPPDTKKGIKEHKIETYKQLFDAILNPKFLTPHLMEFMDSQEKIAITNYGKDHGKVSLKAAAENYRRGDNHPWIQLLSNKRVSLKIFKAVNEDQTLFYQKKDKTAERQRSKVVREIMTAGKKRESPLKFVTMDDVAAGMAVFKYSHNVTGPYANSEIGNEEPLMSKVMSKLYNSDDIKISDFHDLYDDDKFQQNMLKLYARTELNRSGYPKLGKLYSGVATDSSFIDLMKQNERISIHLKDITNYMEDEIGKRSHLIYEFKQNKRKILQSEEAQKYIERLQRFQEGAYEIMEKK